MQRNINSLVGYPMDATDGAIGEVKEFYFDDNTWAIRYLVVKTGNWLSGRKGLISPLALVSRVCTMGAFPVNLTKEQVRNSPDIDTDKPVSRRQEIELYEHYPWQHYWVGGFYAGGIWGILPPEPLNSQKIAVKEDNNHNDKGYDDDLHLRTTERVTGYHIHACDGDIGHVKDFIIDDETWQIVYLVVSTHHWFGGKDVLIRVKNITAIQWDNSKVFVDETLDSVKDSRVFDKSEFIHSSKQ